MKVNYSGVKKVLLTGLLLNQTLVVSAQQQVEPVQVREWKQRKAEINGRFPAIQALVDLLGGVSVSDNPEATDHQLYESVLQKLASSLEADAIAAASLEVATQDIKWKTAQEKLTTVRTKKEHVRDEVAFFKQRFVEVINLLAPDQRSQGEGSWESVEELINELNTEIEALEQSMAALNEEQTKEQSTQTLIETKTKLQALRDQVNYLSANPTVIATPESVSDSGYSKGTLIVAAIAGAVGGTIFGSMLS